MDYNHQMLLKLLLITVFLLIPASCVKCPSNCSCQTATFSCQVCLQYYLQVYSLETKGCECLPGFVLTDQVIDYCHPENCKKSNDWGCATCYPHANITYDPTYQFYNCTCQTNYYLNLTTYLCRCMSNRQPTKYYQDTILDQCYFCPQGCTCTSSGCTSCGSQLMRQVISNAYSSTCYCKYPHRQIDGTCQCAPNCTCSQDGTTNCNSDSKRQFVLGKWTCKRPYIEINGKCQCTDNYVILNTLGYPECVCRSKVNYTQYYEANGSCYKCGINCTCDYTGCVSCFDGSVYINYEACICKDRYIFDGLNCLCIDPYEVYVNPDTGNAQCRCMSYRISSIYSSGDFCAKCPSGCTCNTSGCFSCSDPLRVYTNLSSEFRICGCASNSNQFQGRCSCNSEYTFDATSKSCKCKSAPGILFYDQDNGVCHLCPQGCSCNSSGCNTCISSASRSISTNLQNTKVCYCLSGFVEVNGVCVCQTGYKKIDDTTCVCEDPYYLNDNQECTCKAVLDSSMYFFDDFENKCKRCPPGCICNISGCIDCGSDFLRTIKYSLKTYKYRCPCLQNTFLVGDYCTVCNNNSYSEYLGSLRNISCVKCIQCLTCNRYGCTSCRQNMTLIGTSCICNNQSLINLDGVCNCPLQQYLSDNSCYPCPYKCNSCIQINRTVSCTSCGFDVFRQNLPAEGCPCKDSYKQSSTPSKYCCDIKCQACDASGCLSCPQHTFRVLVGGFCVCTNGFVQQSSLVCLCPNDSYLLNNECFKCPIECQTCSYNSSQQVVTCLSCRDKVNRNRQSPSCQCSKNYIQTSVFKSQFCYAKQCTQEIIKCESCVSPWRIDTNLGYCVCQTGYWINANQGCVQCKLDGCLECSSQLICIRCNQEKNFYLVQTFCSEVSQIDFLAVQTTEQNIIIQCPLNNTQPSLIQISVSLNPIMQPNPSVYKQEIQFKVLEKKLLKDGSILSVTLQTLNETYHNVVISFILEVSGGTNVNLASNSTDITTSQTHSSLKFNLKMDTIYSDSSFNALERIERVGLYFLVIIVILVSFWFYICGQKHNQACFFMQTMSFAGFAIYDTELSTAMFLYNMRFSYYNFSPHNALSNIVPSQYLEESKGNFRYLAVDANIVRNIGIPLIMALIVAILSIIFRIVYQTTKMNPIIQPAGRYIFWKKKIYRMIEFFYKTLQYPLIFFACQALVNWNTSVYVHEDFHRKSIILSIIILVIYSFITFFQFQIQLISNFNKYQNVKQFFNCVIGSFIIIGSQSHPQVILLFIIIFITTQLLYFRYKIQDLWVYRITNIIRLTIIVLEIICIILIVTVSLRALIGMVCVTLLVQMGLMVYKELVDQHYNMISKLTSVALNQEQEDVGSEIEKDFSSKTDI